jgi:hypothetical protein
MEAGAQGALWWQEKLMTAAHVIPAIGIISAFVLMVNGTFRARKESKTE